MTTSRSKMKKMTLEQREARAKVVGVKPETIARWERERGTRYAMTNIPIPRSERGKLGKAAGKNIVLSKKPKTRTELTEEGIARGNLRRACESAEIDREIKRACAEVWQ